MHVFFLIATTKIKRPSVCQVLRAALLLGQLILYILQSWRLLQALAYYFLFPFLLVKSMVVCWLIGQRIWVVILGVGVRLRLGVLDPGVCFVFLYMVSNLKIFSWITEIALVGRVWSGTSVQIWWWSIQAIGLLRMAARIQRPQFGTLEDCLKSPWFFLACHLLTKFLVDR